MLVFRKMLRTHLMNDPQEALRGEFLALIELSKHF